MPDGPERISETSKTPRVQGGARQFFDAIYDGSAEPPFLLPGISQPLQQFLIRPPYVVLFHNLLGFRKKIYVYNRFENAGTSDPLFGQVVPHCLSQSI